MVDPDILDPNIRDIVDALNRAGYKTLASCAGNHTEVPKWEQDPRGYIIVEGWQKVASICKDLGLKRVQIEWCLTPHIHTRVTFTGLGGLSAWFNIKGNTNWPREWIQRNPTEEEFTACLSKTWFIKPE